MVRTRKNRAIACWMSLALLTFILVAHATPAVAAPAYSWDYGYQADLNLIARVVYAEAAGEPYQGKVAVAAVILNRVRSNLFPNTVGGVVYEPWQFSCVGNWMFNSAPDADSYAAARDALNGWDPTGGALYYFNYHQVSNSWLWSKPVATIIGNHLFTY